MLLDELGDAADVVGMVMRGEDRGEPEFFARKVVEHGMRLAGIDDCGVGRVAQRPDVVILERPQWDNVRHDIHAAILRAERGAKV